MRGSVETHESDIIPGDHLEKLRGNLIDINNPVKHI